MLNQVVIPVSLRLIYLKFMTALYRDFLGLDPLLMFNISELLRLFQIMFILIGSFLGQVPLELNLMNTIISFTVLSLEMSDFIFSLAYLMLQIRYIIVSFSCPQLSQVSALVGLLNISVGLVLHSLNFLVHVKHFRFHAYIVIAIVFLL